MPICPGCRNSVSPEDLRIPRGGGDPLCVICCGRLLEEAMEKIFCFKVDKLDEMDGDNNDYEIEVSFALGGAELKYKRKLSQIRNFFARRDEKKQQAQLKSV